MRTLLRFLVLVAFVVTPAASRAQGDVVKFLRQPGVANDGTIAFGWHDDIWVANPDGSNPRRLTAHIARDFEPRFSPDGKTIAFTSNRNGSNNVFLVPVTGGEPRQITWGPGGQEAVSWTPDGKAVVITASYGASQWGSPLFTVTVDCGVPRALPIDQGRSGMIKQDGSMIAYNPSVPTFWRTGYRGNGGADIVVGDLKTGATLRQVTDTSLKAHRQNSHDVHPMWGVDGKVYFASERDGHFNIWRMNPDGSQPAQLTHHTNDGVKFPSISPDGRHIIYEDNFDLWTMDVPNGQPRQLTIRIAADPKDNDVVRLTSNSRADGFWPSPDGDYVALDAHGEIFIVPAENGVGEMKQVTNSAARDQNEMWSPNGKYIAFISDTARENEVWVYEPATGVKRRVSNREAEKTNIVWAPGSNSLLYQADNRLFETDLSKTPIVTREIAYNQAGGYSGISYSADGKWLIYNRSNDDQVAEVYLYEIATKKEINLTHNPIPTGGTSPGVAGGGGRGAGGGAPLLTPDGATVVFTSNRDGTNRVYVLSLTKLTEDVDDPLVRERKAREANAGGRGAGGRGGRGGGGGGGGGGGAEAADVVAAPLTIKVDEQGIDKRPRALPTTAGTIGSVFLAPDGRSVYYTITGGAAPAAGGGRGRGRGGAPAPAAEDAGSSGLWNIGLDGQGNRRVATGNFNGIRPTPDRRSFFFERPVAGGGGGGGRGRGAVASDESIGAFELGRFTLAAPTRIENVTFTFPVIYDRRDEWKQTLLEAWRVMRYRFYDPQMHGRDWKTILAKYEPLLPYARTNEDVQDISNLMIGELNASHTGVALPPTHPMPQLAVTHSLGFEMEEGTGGRYRISHIYRDGPADKEWLDLHDGDYVLAIDNQEIKNGDNYYKLLTNTLNTYIPVKVAKTATGENARTVRIATVTNLGDIKYEEWVNNNRDEVEKATNGEVAYVHIRAMDQPSLEKFEREIDRYWNKQGIIIDIRFNGGGNIDQELIDILERQPYEYWNNRNGSPIWGRRPRQLIAGPKVMMTNGRSASDAEVTPRAFHDLNLGHIVGQPTSAQVIATGSYNLLLQGGTIRTPGSKVMTYDADKPNHYGINLENYGVEPDVWVKNTPMDNLAHNDKELKAAIAEVQKMRQQAKPKITSNNNDGTGRRP